MKWILSGATEHDIAEAMAQAWPAENLAELLLAAVVQIRKSATVDPETVRGWCFEATKDLYRRMLDRSSHDKHDPGGTNGRDRGDKTGKTGPEIVRRFQTVEIGDFTAALRAVKQLDELGRAK